MRTHEQPAPTVVSVLLTAWTRNGRSPGPEGPFDGLVNAVLHAIAVVNEVVPLTLATLQHGGPR